MLRDLLVLLKSKAYYSRVVETRTHVPGGMPCLRAIQALDIAGCEPRLGFLRYLRNSEHVFLPCEPHALAMGSSEDRKAIGEP